MKYSAALDFNAILQVTFTTPTHQWNLPIPSIDINVWMDMEIAWHETNGLSVWVNNQLIGTTTVAIERTVTVEVTQQTTMVLIGTGSTENSHSGGCQTGDIMIFYTDDRELLVNDGVLPPGMYFITFTGYIFFHFTFISCKSN